ncbi:MAG: STAS domain-containing protein [Solirubrobacterales bacterium]|nr:STAS domain-containing protein [Solirubrobacterales bacterium]
MNGRGTPWIRLSGELDLASVPQLKRTLGIAAVRARRIVLDLRELSFMDSSGLHLIIDATNRQRQAGGSLLLVRGPHQIDRLFELTRATDAIDFIDFAPPAPAVISLDHPAESQHLD